MAHRVREQDLRDGAREEQWSRLYDLKSRSAALELQQGADKAIDLLGEPTGIVRYTVWTEGTTLMKNNSTERFSADQLSIADRPFSLRYDPEGWEHLGRGDYPFRALVLDFTADRKLFQWYFEPLPSSPDW
ncbi:MAG TPA: hypothetical protein DCY13_23570 [Verrucomicrobiales bacterium]|nr:hypothetical protein [Verrucomicrobiales bacterium]